MWEIRENRRNYKKNMFLQHWMWIFYREISPIEQYTTYSYRSSNKVNIDWSIINNKLSLVDVHSTRLSLNKPFTKWFWVAVEDVIISKLQRHNNILLDQINIMSMPSSPPLCFTSSHLTSCCAVSPSQKQVRGTTEELFTSASKHAHVWTTWQYFLIWLGSKTMLSCLLQW